MSVFKTLFLIILLIFLVSAAIAFYRLYYLPNVVGARTITTTTTFQPQQGIDSSFLFERKVFILFFIGN